MITFRSQQTFLDDQIAASENERYLPRHLVPHYVNANAPVKMANWGHCRDIKNMQLPPEHKL